MRFANENLLLFAVIAALAAAGIVLLRNFMHGKIGLPSVFAGKNSPGAGSFIHHIPDILKVTAVILFCIALLRPQGVKKETEEKIKGLDIIMCLDVSGSMQAEDLPPNRLEAAKEVLDRFVSGLKTDRVGLIVFAGRAFTQCPLTSDYEILKSFISQVDFSTVRIDGTAVGEAILAGINRLEPSGSSKVLILATDGVSNTGLDTMEAAKMAAVKGIKLYTIGIGRQGGVVRTYTDQYGNKRQAVDRYTGQVIKWEEPDERTLKAAAEITGGLYFRAVNKSELSKVYADIAIMEKQEIKIRNYDRYEEYFFYFLAAGILLMLLALVFEILTGIRVLS